MINIESKIIISENLSHKELMDVIERMCGPGLIDGLILENCVVYDIPKNIEVVEYEERRIERPWPFLNFILSRLLGSFSWETERSIDKFMGGKILNSRINNSSFYFTTKTNEDKKQ